MSNHVRATSGLTDQDVVDTKVFLRTINDAMICAQDIAQMEAGRAHYRDYVRLLTRGLRTNKLMVDDKGEVVSGDSGVSSIYNLMRFSNAVSRRYGLHAENISSKDELDQRMDRALNGLEYEIYLK